MPEGARAKLSELFNQIEQQFELVHLENTALRDRVDRLEQMMAERNSTEVPQEVSTPTSATPPDHLTGHTHSALSGTPFKKVNKIKNSAGQAITKKIMTYTPSKWNRSNISTECSQVKVFSGHRDGVWQVTHARNGMPLLGTASADGTACVWDAESAHLLLKYMGHAGSVNSLTFHPQEQLVCSVAGDNTIHIWKCHVTLPPRQRRGSNSERTKQDSSGEDRYCSDDDLDADGHQAPPVSVIKSPLISLPGHKAPVMSCDWLPNGHQLVTGSWDHTAKLWDFESAQVIHSLEGHDQELTHVCAHPKQQLLVTSSLDATFRLWDFRAPPIHSVNVFQGHSKAVNSAVFSLKEHVISGSDDHTVKIWDLRNMRSPVDSIRLDCGVNRLAVSHDERGLLAVPLDNRHIKLYDLTGSRVAHLPRRNRQGHRRMVYSVTWSPESHMTPDKCCNLFSSGFDDKVIGWKVTMVTVA